MGLKLAQVQNHPHTFETESQCFHSQNQRLQQEEHQEIVLQNFSALSMLMSTHRSLEPAQSLDLLRNVCPSSRPLSATPSLVSPSPFPCTGSAPVHATSFQSMLPRPTDSKLCSLQSLETSDGGTSGSASSTSSADSLQSPGTPIRTFGKPPGRTRLIMQKDLGNIYDSSAMLRSLHGSTLCLRMQPYGVGWCLLNI